MNSTARAPKLRIGHLEAAKPIIQGGMGVGISMTNLAAAVANEGAIGVISSVGIGSFDKSLKGDFFENNKTALAAEIRKARKMTKGILGVNIMVAVTDFESLLQAAVDAHIDIVFLGAGLPLRGISEIALRERKTQFVPIVSSARTAELVCKFWSSHFQRLPDAFVVEGPMAGGHLGFSKEQIDDQAFALEKILVEVLNVVSIFAKKFNCQIPVIAAGGIYSGADICKYLRLGASGVQMGTRFVATHECDADIAFKQAYIDCKKSDLTIISSPVGLPGRAIKNKFIDDINLGIKKPFICPKKCLKTCDYKKVPYCIFSALYSAKLGRLNNGFAFAGYNAYRVDKIVSVKELLTELMEDYLTSANLHD